MEKEKVNQGLKTECKKPGFVAVELVKIVKRQQPMNQKTWCPRVATNVIHGCCLLHGSNQIIYGTLLCNKVDGIKYYICTYLVSKRRLVNGSIGHVVCTYTLITNLIGQPIGMDAIYVRYIIFHEHILVVESSRGRDKVKIANTGADFGCTYMTNLPIALSYTPHVQNVAQYCLAIDP